jgi:hypothetical protein
LDEAPEASPRRRIVSSAVNLGGAGAPFAATAATGDVVLVLVVPFNVAEVTGDAAVAGFIAAAGLGLAEEIASDSGTEAVDAPARAACLYSTDFKFPRVAMIQSVSPKQVLIGELRNPCFLCNELRSKPVSTRFGELPRSKC